MSSAKCSTWQKSNLGKDSGTKCGDCIFASKDNGAAYVADDGDGNGFFGPNFAACMQLADGNNTCATAFNNANDCITWYCAAGCGTSSADYTACSMTAQTGQCKSQITAFQSACKADFAKGGSADACGATANMVTDAIWTPILNEICGSGGTKDAGGKG